MITPMNRDGSVNEEQLRRLVDFQEENGVDMLLPCGSTGEAATLTTEEHLKVISIVVDQAKKAKVVAGAGSNCTREAVELTRKASDIGADGILSISPYYVKPTQEGIYLHYKAIAEATDLPVIIYNIPGRTGSNITAETELRMAEIPNIAGVKEASGNIEQIQQIIAGRPKGFTVLSGDDSLTFDIMCSGGDGVFSVVSNFLPKQMSQMVKALQEGRRDEAREMHNFLMPIFKGAFIESNPIPAKYIMSKLGFGSEIPRLPLTPIAETSRTRLEEILSQYGL